MSEVSFPIPPSPFSIQVPLLTTLTKSSTFLTFIDISLSSKTSSMFNINTACHTLDATSSATLVPSSFWLSSSTFLYIFWLTLTRQSMFRWISPSSIRLTNKTFLPKITRILRKPRIRLSIRNIFPTIEFSLIPSSPGLTLGKTSDTFLILSAS